MGGKEGLIDIAAHLRGALAEDPAASEELRHGRAAFLREVERRHPPSRVPRASSRHRPGWLPLSVAASIAVGAAGLWLWMRPSTFQIGEAHQGRLGDLIEASDGKVVPVSFSEGSMLAVNRGGRIRVLSVERGATSVLVEEGTIDATIVHRKTGGTKWEFEAGPYRVTVNGTKFRLAYQVTTGALRVSTEEGRVTVTGGCLRTPLAVSAGESLAPACAPKEAPPLDDDALPGRVEPVEPVTPAAASGGLTESLRATKAARGGRWRELLAAGRLLEGLREAERGNFERVCGTATAKELLALADAGRFFGPSQRAVAALGALRRRFPRSMDAGTAAFTLGRIVFESGHAYSQAADWFQIYLREQPNGPLMGDAFGRLMESRLRSGDGQGARTSAQQYLRRFPQGPYASEARGILSR